MSEWHISKIVLSIKSPLHIGDINLGVVNLTKRYLPAINIFNAVSSVVAKSIMTDYYPSVYEHVKKVLRKIVFFTNFFPYNLEKKELYLPVFKEDGLQYLIIKEEMNCTKISKGSNISLHTLSPYEFDYHYIDSYTSTGINHRTGGHEESSLYEVEMLKNNSNLGLMGYLIFKEKVNINNEIVKECEIDLLEEFDKVIQDESCEQVINMERFRKALKEKRNTLWKINIPEGKLKINQPCLINWLEQLEYEGVGGKRKNGKGQVKLEQISSMDVGGPMFVEQDIAGLELPTLKINDGKPTLEYTPGVKSLVLHPINLEIFNFHNGEIIGNFSGNFRPSVGRLWNNKKVQDKGIGAGRFLEYRGVEIVPGSVVEFFKEIRVPL